ncbi:MAG: hypothetical protein NZ519_10230 [Bacteroidia bacterium]|nr:hypothetical protein [Bacteroidia bacterium]MDW8302072.1 hypothetical protein [Bacteroidia bacterium]
MIQFQIISRGEDLSTIQESSLVDNLIVVDVHVYQFIIQTDFTHIERFDFYIGEQNLIEQLSQKVGKDKLAQYIQINQGTITFEPFMYFEDSAIGQVKITIEVNDEVYSEEVSVESRRVDKKQYALMIETLQREHFAQNKDDTSREILLSRLNENIKQFCQFVQNNISTLKCQSQKKYYTALFNPSVKTDSSQVRELAQKPTYIYSDGCLYLPRHVQTYTYEENYNIPENQYILHKILEVKHKLRQRMYYLEQQEENYQHKTGNLTFIEKIILENLTQEKCILHQCADSLTKLVNTFTQLGVQPQKAFYYTAVCNIHAVQGIIERYSTSIIDTLNSITFYQSQSSTNISVRNNWELFEQFTYIYLRRVLSQMPDFKDCTHKFYLDPNQKNIVFIKDEGTDKEERIELVYHFDQVENNPIGMFQSIYTQHNLTPDFVLKYTNPKTKKYFIMDSKFTFYKNAEDKARELKDKYLNSFVTEDNKYIDGVFAITPYYAYKLEVINSYHVTNKPRNYPVYGWITIPISGFYKHQPRNLITDLINL